MKHQMFEWVRVFLRWWFGAPFQELSSEFGDPIPVELRLFAAEVQEIQHGRSNRLQLAELANRSRV